MGCSEMDTGIMALNKSFPFKTLVVPDQERTGNIILARLFISA